MKIVLTGDWHLGQEGVSLDTLSKIARTEWKGKKVILLGDLIDCGIDRGMQFDNVLNPQEQVDALKLLLKELNIIGYVNGNHEQRYFRTTGINILKTLLDVAERHKVNVAGRKIFINHGKSIAQNVFAEFDKYTRFYDADVYVLGHNHELVCKVMLYDEKRRYFVRSGTFLRTARYTEDAGYPPKFEGWAEYDTTENFIELKGIINKVVRRI